MVRSGLAVMARQVLVRRGSVGQGSAVKVRFAVFRPVMACSGKARYGSRGKLRHVRAWFGAARCGSAGT